MRIRPLIAAGFAALVLAGCWGSRTPDPRGGTAGISPELIRRHVDYLASDALKGRNTPSPGLDTAAAYIARAFGEAGVRPVHGSRFQSVALTMTSLGDSNALVVRAGGRETPFTIKSQFTPFEMTASREVRGEVLFAGYGITAPEYGYDDYAGVEARGRVVFVLRHEPGEEDSSSVFKGRRATDYSNVATKVRIALEHGAAGVLVATDPLNHTLLTPRGYPWPSLSKVIPRDAVPLTLATDEEKKLPVAHVGEEVIETLFGSVDSLRRLQIMIDEGSRPRSFPLRAEATLRTSTVIREVRVRNVVGVIEGTDPTLREEVVVVGAHYDHVGTKREHAPGEDSVYNGADDNASGTSAMMAVAAAFGAVPTGPLRTVLFVAFAGEEKGLFGSEYYARHPLYPLRQTVAMLNLDMVGRGPEDSLQIIGAASAPDLARIVREENRQVGFRLLEEDISYGGSDHESFQRRQIPSLFFHTGLHPEFHRVTDHAELVNAAKAARVARLAFLTAWRLANEPARYGFTRAPGPTP